MVRKGERPCPNAAQYTFKLNLIQGEPIIFKLRAAEERRRNAAARLEKAMDLNFVGLKLSDKLILLPTHNIQSVEITPPPPKKMANVIEDAVSIEGD